MLLLDRPRVATNVNSTQCDPPPGFPFDGWGTVGAVIGNRVVVCGGGNSGGRVKYVATLKCSSHENLFITGLPDGSEMQL